MVDILVGVALHRYFLKITVESPIGIVESQQRLLISGHDLFTVGGNEKLQVVARGTFDQVKAQLPDGYSIAVEVIKDKHNALVMN